MAKQDFPRRADDPEDISIDPAVLIDRASRRASTEEIDQTIIIQRPDASRRPRGRRQPERRHPRLASDGRPSPHRARCPAAESHARRPGSQAQPASRTSRSWLPGVRPRLPSLRRRSIGMGTLGRQRRDDGNRRGGGRQPAG